MLERMDRALGWCLCVLGLMQWAGAFVFFRSLEEPAFWFFNGGTTLLLLGALNLLRLRQPQTGLVRLSVCANLVVSAFWIAMCFALWSKLSAHPASFTGPVVTLLSTVLSLRFALRGR